MKLTKLKNKDGWSGWCGSSNLYAYPEDKPIESVMTALAELAHENKEGAYIISNTATHHRVIGWGYIPQGYRNTPDGPKLYLVCIEGGSLLS